MRVKIGDKIYDASNEPIMIVLSEEDKKNIANMADDAEAYCGYPDHMKSEDILEWMAK